MTTRRSIRPQLAAPAAANPRLSARVALALVLPLPLLPGVVSARHHPAAILQQQLVAGESCR